MTLAAAVARAVGAYSAMVSDRRGLAAADAADAMREHHERALVDARGDTVAALRPDLALAGVAIDRASRVALLHFADADEAPVLVRVGAADADNADWN